jgi:hypothetical protein
VAHGVEELPQCGAHVWGPGRVEQAGQHGQLNEKSLTDAFLVGKADGVQVAKIEAVVKEENER